MSSLVPLIDTFRGGTLECRHFGVVAVADTTGRVLAHAGDPHWLTFTRSTLKALQALPFVEGGGPAHFGFSDRQLAMLCASHNGEPKHVEEVQDMLQRAGLTHRVLQCGCHVPMYAEAGVAPAPPHGSWDERHHNCSGKHAGFVAWCVQHGQPVETYLEAGHPLQQAIRRDVARAAGLEPDRMKSGTDGCSAPNYAMPLAHLARAYARLASGSRDPEFGASFDALSRAMTAYPDLVSGTGRNDLAFMQVGRGDWVTKVGAEGVQAVGSVSRGQAFAIKVIDGNKTALYAATVEVLDQLGWLDERQREELRPWRSSEIASVKGAVVGERRAAFRLEGAA
ncbi:asparaginase [Ramlibacter henchirensis]|uniref:Asparaginase n=1 Tax=Ramlibacter henchirensis TaxID=204072 RepID=A0A4Z0C6W7_9BURK|nr:asparaginase [Ramlibacter henchirensis]TFZ07031.1 asparaginase [Ramlibacter henchirensis]